MACLPRDSNSVTRGEQTGLTQTHARRVPGPLAAMEVEGEDQNLGNFATRRAQSENGCGVEIHSVYL